MSQIRKKRKNLHRTRYEPPLPYPLCIALVAAVAPVVLIPPAVLLFRFFNAPTNSGSADHRMGDAVAAIFVGGLITSICFGFSILAALTQINKSWLARILVLILAPLWLLLGGFLLLVWG